MASENIIMEMVKSGADRQVKFRLQLEFYLYIHIYHYHYPGMS